MSLLISTYNWEDALRLCLLSASVQTVLPDEIVIADDGGEDVVPGGGVHAADGLIQQIQLCRPAHHHDELHLLPPRDRLRFHRRSLLFSDCRGMLIC